MLFARRNTLSTSITKALIFHAHSNFWLFSAHFCRFLYPHAAEFLKACSIAPTTQNTYAKPSGKKTARASNYRSRVALFKNALRIGIVIAGNKKPSIIAGFFMAIKLRKSVDFVYMQRLLRGIICRVI